MIKGLDKFATFVKGVEKAAEKVEKIVNRELELALPQLDAERQARFDAERDPYGVKWKKRKHDKPWPILNKSGFLKGSFKSKVVNTDVEFTNDAPYAKFHQEGTSVINQRKILPTADKGIPQVWLGPVKRRIIKAIKEEILNPKK